MSNDNELSSRVSELEKHSLSLYTALENHIEYSKNNTDKQEKILDRLDSTMTDVKSMCVGMETIIKSHETSIRDIKDISTSQHENFDKKYMDLLNVIHTSDLKSLERNNENKDEIKKSSDELEKKISDKIDKNDKRITMVEQYKWKTTGIAVGLSVVATVIVPLVLKLFAAST